MQEVPVSKAWNMKYPEQIGMAVTVDAKGTANVIALGWLMPTSGSPPMVAISVGHSRYTHELIRQCREFVVAFPSEDQGKEMLFCGTYSGRKVNKEKESGFAFVPAKRVRPPLIQGCVANFECRLVSEHNTGDHTIFVGEILTAHIEQGKGRLYTLGGGDFGGVRPIKKLSVGDAT